MLPKIPRNWLMSGTILKCGPPNKRKICKTLFSYFTHTFHIASQIRLPKPRPDQDTHLDTSKTIPTKEKIVPPVRNFK